MVNYKKISKGFFMLRALLFSGMVLSSSLIASVTGEVFNDINANGIKDSNEVGVADFKIIAYNADNKEIATSLSANDGSFTLDVNESVRVELKNSSENLILGHVSATSNSNVLFAKDGDSVRFPLYTVDTYCEENPQLVTTAYISGDPLKGGSASNEYALISFSSALGDSTKTTLAKSSQVGATWGVAYNGATNKLYTSAVAKRYSGFGALGAGGIYEIDTNSLTVLPFVTIQSVGLNVLPSKRELPADKNVTIKDDLFSEIGKTSLGGLDILNNKLYTINLSSKKLVEIDIASKQVTKEVELTNSFANCKYEFIRPWAVKAYQGEVYVGSVCSNDMSEGASISKLTEAGFETLVQVPLNYNRDNIYLSTDVLLTNEQQMWHIWDSSDFNFQTFYPQPILSDIEFDSDGSMILAFSDRTGLQSGNLDARMAGGDIRRVCKVGESFIPEGTSDLCKANKHDNREVEYYVGDEFILGSKKEREITTGGIAYLPSSLVALAYDPVDSGLQNSNGVIYLDHQSGKKLGAKVLMESAESIFESTQQGRMGKAGGFGDLEALCSNAPIQLGNYIWEDANENGRQDAGERALEGIGVELYEVNGEEYTFVEKVLSSEKGEYYFNNLNPNTTYQLRIRLNDINLKGRELTTTGCLCDEAQIYSKGEKTGIAGVEYATISYTTQGYGINNHSLDFGFKPNPLSHISGRVWEDSNFDGILDENESALDGIKIDLFGDVNCTGDILASTFSDAGIYSFDKLEAGDYCVRFGNLPANYQPTKANQGEEAVSSKADQLTKKAKNINLSESEQISTIHAGFSKVELYALDDNGTININLNRELSIFVSANDYSLNGDKITICDYNATSQNGAVINCSENGYCSYRVPLNFMGEDSFEYTICTPLNQKRSARVDVTIEGDNLFYAPYGAKVIKSIEWPRVEWEITLINNRNIQPVSAKMVDPISFDMELDVDSLTCEEKGSSEAGGISCIYEDINRQIVWDGIVYPDYNKSYGDTLNHAVTIRFSTIAQEGVTQLLNQGEIYWNTLGTNSRTLPAEVASRSEFEQPSLTSDPNSLDSFSPTVANKTVRAPLSNQAKLALVVLFFASSLYFLRRRHEDS
jgi:hypothetical protein